MVKQLLKSVREYKNLSLVTLFFITAEVIIEVFIPFMTADLVNRIEAGEEISYVVKTGIILTVMAAASLTCGGIAGFTCAKASAGFAKNLRQDIFDKVQTFSFDNIDRFSSSSLVTRMTTDINNIQMSYMMIIRTAVRAPLMIVFAIIMAYRMGGMLSMSFVIIVPFMATGLWLVAKKAMPAFRRVFRKYDKLNESIEENVRAMRVVKGFSREEYEKEKFASASDNIRKDFTFAERIVALNAPILQVCVYANMIFVMLIGSKLTVQSRGATVNVGQMSAMLTYGMQIMLSLMMLSLIFVIITISVESIKRVCEVLGEEPAITEPESPVTQVKDGSIDFENVNYRYSKNSENYSLKDINIHIDSGMTVGILGGTGSGKSSLVQLIPRLYDLGEGEGAVKVGGINVKNYSLDTIRDSVAMVLQKNLLFSGTIAENLRWGNPEATQEELEDACKLACAHDFVMSFPDGYETMIEQGGTNVSGGQKQRLCIARALLKKPKILILDDSTSAVDTRTDAFIRKSFKEYIPETTKLIIAQRVSSVEDADLIIVMDGGKINGTGTHKELLETNEIYRDIYSRQVNGGDGDE
ncbi:MAG: ABC transporter ATP-binding protein [Clostridia bacterium]|nr:ABC transporter ATP-binding protein [Clostridia bacterium]